MLVFVRVRHVGDVSSLILTLAKVVPLQVILLAFLIVDLLYKLSILVKILVAVT